MALIEVRSPAQNDRESELDLAPRSGALEGRRLGLLGNGKANAGLLLDMVERAIRESGLRAEVVRVNKQHSGVPVELGALEGCAAVITAIGD
jgi:hypothetical protein